MTEPFALPAGFCSHILRSIREVPVCSTTFSLSTGTVLTGEQLKQYPLIGLGDKTGSFTFYSELFNKMGMPFMPDIEAATAEQILPMINRIWASVLCPRIFWRKKIWKI